MAELSLIYHLPSYSLWQHNWPFRYLSILPVMASCTN